MPFYDVSLIESTIIDPMLDRVVSQPTRTKWRRLAGICSYSRYCDEEQGLMLLSVALLRLRYPTKPISESDVIRFRIENYDEVLAAIKGCRKSSPLRLVKPVGISECINLIAELGRQKITASTLRRWCLDLGIHYSANATFNDTDIERLIELCNKLRQERVYRGKELGSLRRTRQPFDFREAI